MKKQNSKRGGARKNAGRKPAGTVRMQIAPLRDTAKRLRDRARRENKTPGQILDEIFAIL